ncbi:MAG: hypothetical protein IT308_10960 [Anaerolineaceae bacterium]|nr:hypothetical protein [Anaerolineaceae bacterium]
MFLHRFGVFALMIGLALIGLFILSGIANAIDYKLLVGGGAMSVLGGLLLQRNRLPPPQPSERFRIFRHKAKRVKRKEN